MQRSVGYLFLQRLSELLPNHELTVFSFREVPGEPPFLINIERLSRSIGARFYEQTRIENEASVWADRNNCDLMFAVNWRFIIPREIYELPRLGTFVFHDSLLPKYRGFSPTIQAIIHGEDHTGATLFEISEGVDEGYVIDQQRIPIGPSDTIQQVSHAVTDSYLELLERNLVPLLKGTAPRTPQDHSQATYYGRRRPEDNMIDWSKPSKAIHNLIRAVTYPYPGAYTYLSRRKLTIWSAEPFMRIDRNVHNAPGTVLSMKINKGLMVQTIDGAMLLRCVQFEDGPRMCATDLVSAVGNQLRAIK